MHVAIAAEFWGRADGSGQYLHHLVDALRPATSGIRLTLLLGPGARPAPLPAGVQAVDCAPDWAPRLPNPAKLWYEQVGVPRTARRVGADLLHVPYFAPPLWSPLPVVATIHDLIPIVLPDYRGGPHVRAYTALVARAARGAAAVIADSEASRRDILDHLALAPSRTHTIYLAAASRFRPQPEAAIQAVRTRYSLPERFVLYLGGMDRRKNLTGLIGAVARSHGTWPLVIAGRLPSQDRPFTPDPRRLAREAGVTGRLHLTDWIAEEDKPALLAAATLFVFPALYEGFGLPLLEAMACGTASVTSDRASLPEIAGDGAEIVAGGEPGPLAAALDRLMADDQERAALAARGLDRAATFSWQRCAAETAAVYHLVAP